MARGKHAKLGNNGTEGIKMARTKNILRPQFFAHASYLGNDACEAQIGARYDRVAFTVAVATAGGEDGSDSHIDK